MKKIASLFAFLLFSGLIKAQQPIEMADAMRQDGKIYVVVAVLGIVFIGIVGFLIYLERRVSKLEKQPS